MELFLGILFLLLGMMFSAYAFRVKEKFSLSWGGFNLLSLGMGLVVLGFYFMKQ